MSRLSEPAGLLLFSAGFAGTLYGAPGLTPLLGLAAVPVFVRAWRARGLVAQQRPNNGPAQALLILLWSVALLMVLSPILFTAAFATFWVVCAALAGGLNLNGAAVPANPDPTALVASVTTALLGLGMIVRSTLLAERCAVEHHGPGGPFDPRA